MARFRCPIDDAVFDTVSTDSMPHHTGHPDCPICAQDQKKVAALRARPEFSVIKTQAPAAGTVPIDRLERLERLVAALGDQLLSNRAAPAAASIARTL